MQDLPAEFDGERRRQRRWWSPAPFPELPPISAKRAYIEVLGVYSAFFLTGVISAALLLAGRFQNVLSDASWALYGTQTVDVIAQIGLAGAVVLLLAERRGVRPATLGLWLPRRPSGSFDAAAITRIAAWAFFAQVLGGIINVALQTGHLPLTKASGPELVFAVADSVQAGVIEELVVLAFVVVTLRQAGRPLWEITLVALVLRGSYHIYYGPGVVGILVWAALFYWLYLRTQSLIPLMVTHAAWDAVSFLGRRWPAVAGVGGLVILALWIAGPITWLVERGDRKRALKWSGGVAGVGVGGAGGFGAGAGAGVSGGVGARGWGVPPGWHPDPSGVNQWRWWDGTAWTDHVSGVG